MTRLDEAETDETNLPNVLPMDAAYFDRAWGLEVLSTALARTRKGYAASGKEALYEGLKEFLSPRTQPQTYEEAAAALGSTMSAVKTEIHRLRQAFRAAVRAEIGQTVTAPHEIEIEVRHLRAVMAGPNIEWPPPAATRRSETGIRFEDTPGDP